MMRGAFSVLGALIVVVVFVDFVTTTTSVASTRGHLARRRPGCRWS